MGVELRSFQRQFHTLMETMKPQVRPRFVVWLDERLAEFKIKGHMELEETLEDPEWIKNYLSSKHHAKELEIMKREVRDTDSSGNRSEIHPKLEAKSESSNGLDHADDFQYESNEEKDNVATEAPSTEKITETSVTDQDFQLVEVKQEQIEEDDDDMIIVGETLAPQHTEDHETSYNQYNPNNRQMYSGFRNYGPFQRKRNRYGYAPWRTSLTAIGNRSKNRAKPKPVLQVEKSIPSHTVTSQSLIFLPTSSSEFQNDEQVCDTDYSSQMYNENITYTAPESSPLQSNNSVPTSIGDVHTDGVYNAEDGKMYTQYGAESYDSSYVDADGASLQYIDDNNVLLQDLMESSSLDPTLSTGSTLSTEFPVHVTFGEKKRIITGPFTNIKNKIKTEFNIDNELFTIQVWSTYFEDWADCLENVTKKCKLRILQYEPQPAGTTNDVLTHDQELDPATGLFFSVPNPLPMPYKLPKHKIPLNIIQELNANKILQNLDRSKLLSAIYTDVSLYTLYPSSKQYDAIVFSIIRAWPHLLSEKDLQSEDAVHRLWKSRIRMMFHNRRKRRDYNLPCVIERKLKKNDAFTQENTQP